MISVLAAKELEFYIKLMRTKIYRVTNDNGQGERGAVGLVLR